MLIKHQENNQQILLEDNWRRLVDSKPNLAKHGSSWAWMTVVVSPTDEAVFVGFASESERYYVGRFPESVESQEFEADGAQLAEAWAEFMLKRPYKHFVAMA